MYWIYKLVESISKGGVRREMLEICSGEMNSAFTVCVASLGLPLVPRLCIFWCSFYWRWSGVAMMCFSSSLDGYDPSMPWFGWFRLPSLDGCRRPSWIWDVFLVVSETTDVCNVFLVKVGCFSLQRLWETCAVVKSMSNCLDFWSWHVFRGNFEKLTSYDVRLWLFHLKEMTRQQVWRTNKVRDTCLV